MHRSQVRPLFGDVDAMNVVYYGNYLRFFELGRAELMRSTGRAYSDLAQEGMHLAVTETGVRYHRSALYDQLLTVEASVAWIKKASLRFNYKVLGPEDRGSFPAGHGLHGARLRGPFRKDQAIPRLGRPLLEPHLEN